MAHRKLRGRGMCESILQGVGRKKRGSGLCDARGRQENRGSSLCECRLQQVGREKAWEQFV